MAQKPVKKSSDSHLHIILPTAHLQKLQEMARTQQVPVSSVARWAIIDYITGTKAAK